jgi:hypothetical protein
MAHKNIDRCKETTSTTGTGTLTLTGAVAEFVGVCNATNGLTVNGDTGWFEAKNGAEWEIFLGTRVDATHLARTNPPISSSNAGAAVSFTSPPVVFSTVPGAKLSAAGGPAVSAYRATSNQSITSETPTKIQLNAETFDEGACFDSTTNYRWTPDIPGYYQVSFSANFGAASSLTNVLSSIYRNGAVIAYGSFTAPAATTQGISAGSVLVYMNGTTDYLELYGYCTGTTVVVNFGAAGTFMSGYLARPA